jgi:multidrug transporter EmrE-like cation transporter
MLMGLNIVIFLILQIGTAMGFKWGSSSPHLYWWGFVVGNSFGLLSTLAYINVFKQLNANVAVAVCSGGAFVAVQLAMGLIYRNQINWWTGLGAMLIVIGIITMALLSPTSEG